MRLCRFLWFGDTFGDTFLPKSGTLFAQKTTSIRGYSGDCPIRGVNCEVPAALANRVSQLRHPLTVETRKSLSHDFNFQPTVWFDQTFETTTAHRQNGLCPGMPFVKNRHIGPNFYALQCARVKQMTDGFGRDAELHFSKQCW